MMLWWDLRVAAWDKINKGGGESTRNGVKSIKIAYFCYNI